MRTGRDSAELRTVLLPSYDRLQKYAFVSHPRFGLLSLRVLVSLLLPALGWSLNPQIPLQQEILEKWGAAEGLPHPTVNAIQQTPDGYLWVGTSNGLARFDGVRFVPYGRDNTPVLRSNGVNRLVLEAGGGLLIGTNGDGLVRLRHSVFTAYSQAQELPNQIVLALLDDRQGSLWVGTNNGLARLHHGRCTVFTTRDGLPNNSVHDVQRDHDGALWVATEGGLARYAQGHFHSYTVRDGLPSNTVYRVLPVPDGTTWVATEGGLAHLRPGGIDRWTEHEGLLSNAVYCLLWDRDGSLWLGSRAGLSRFREGHFEHFTSQDGLPQNRVASLYEDREGSLWIGLQGGLVHLRDTTFRHLGVPEGLNPPPNTWSVYEDSLGTMWLGTGAGLVAVRADGTLRRYTVRDGLPSDNILTVSGEADGTLWVGTNHGLSRKRNETFTNWGPGEGLPGRGATALCPTRSGTLWIGTNQGLARLDQGATQPQPVPTVAAGDFITSVREDHQGRLWVATEHGLRRHGDTDRWFTTRNGLPSEEVYDTYEDTDGAVWVTTDRGLARITGDHIVKLGPAAPPLAEGYFTVLEDAQGYLWLSGSNNLKGPVRVSRQDLNRYAAGVLTSVVVRQFTQEDGMRTPECNGGDGNAAWRRRNGQLWFATNAGALLADPAWVHPNRTPPPVVIEEAVADGRTLPEAGTVRLPAGCERLDLHYTALDLAQAKQQRFRYRLEPYDTHWVEAGTTRVARYTHLPPGQYRLHVLAANVDGVWNEVGAMREITQNPFFYQTGWFHILETISVLLGLWVLYQLRLHQVRHEFSLVLAERTRVARELHDTLLQGFTGLTLEMQALSWQLLPLSPAAKTSLDRLITQAGRYLTEARQSIWDLREAVPKSDNLAFALSEMLPSVTAGSSIQTHVRTIGTPFEFPLDTHLALLRIAREALTNVIRHAQASRIDVTLRYEGQRVDLSVQDNGRGFAVEAQQSAFGGHWGLLGMRERAEHLGGRLTIDSQPGQGTTVRVEVPRTSSESSRPSEVP